MNKQSFKILAIVLLVSVSFFLQSCSESDDPSMAKTELQMKATTDQSLANSSGRTANTVLVFHEVLLGVRELEFKTIEESGLEVKVKIESETSLGDDHDSKDDDDSDDDNPHEYEVEYEGQFVVDLIQGTSNPDFGIADLAPGLYKEIEIKTDGILEDGNSMFVAFEYTPAGASESVMVEFSTKAEIEVEIEKESGIQFSGGELNKILVLVDLDALFGGINLDEATVDGDGVIRINGSSNTNLAAAIASNFSHCVKGGEDNDDDDKIDDDGDDD